MFFLFYFTYYIYKIKERNLEMNKKELINELAKETGLPSKDAESFLTAFTKTVKETLNDGNSISLIGFGTFCPVDKAAREARNPITGEKIFIAAKRVPAFKPGKTFKDFLN